MRASARQSGLENAPREGLRERVVETRKQVEATHEFIVNNSLAAVVDVEEATHLSARAAFDPPAPAD